MNENLNSTKFEELCSAYRKAQGDFRKYPSDCNDFAVDLWNRMIDNFGIPHSQLALFRANNDGEYELIPPPMFNAISLRDDGYFEVGFGISVYETPNTFPQETIIIGLLFKKTGENQFTLKLIDSDEEFIINRNNNSDYKIFFDYLFRVISKSYSKGLQTFLDQDVTRRPIGFMAGKIKQPLKTA